MNSLSKSKKKRIEKLFDELNQLDHNKLETKKYDQKIDIIMKRLKKLIPERFEIRCKCGEYMKTVNNLSKIERMFCFDCKKQNTALSLGIGSPFGCDTNALEKLKCMIDREYKLVMLSCIKKTLITKSNKNMFDINLIKTIFQFIKLNKSYHKGSS